MTLRFVLVLSSCFFAQILYSQSQNLEASNSYQPALDEETEASDIQVLQKAVASAPKSVQALLQLGRAYKQTQQFQKAKTYLMRAYTARLAEIDNNTKSTILYELALTYKSLGQTKASEDAFRGARNLAESGRQRSRISLELGEILFQREHYSEAMAELSQCKQLAAKEQHYYEQLVDATSKSLEAEKLYGQALQAETNRQETKAIEIYKKLEASMPGFRDVQSRIDRLTPVRKRSVNRTPSVADAPPPAPVPAAAPRHVAPARAESAHQRPVQPSPQKHKPAVARGKAPQPPNPVRKAIRSRSPKRIVVKYNQQAPAETPPAASERQAQAKSRSLKRPRMNRIQLRRTSSGTSMTDKERGAADHTTPTTYRSTYNTDTAKPNANQDVSRVFLLGSLAMGLLILPLVGLVMALPAFRARMFLLLGLPRRAVPIYERMLLKHPDALWLYPSLAELYYSDNRQDEQAMSVYRMIQHLNANNTLDDSLTVNILNRYLSNIETAPVQIDVLENTPPKKR